MWPGRPGKVSSMSCLPPACVRKEEEWWLVWSKYLLHKIAQIKLPAALSCKEKYKLQLPAKTGEMVSALTTLQPLP